MDQVGMLRDVEAVEIGGGVAESDNFHFSFPLSLPVLFSFLFSFQHHSHFSRYTCVWAVVIN